MKNAKNILQVIKKGVAKTILITALVHLGALLLLVVLIQAPFIQTVVVKRVADELSQTLGYQVGLSKVNIKWFDNVLLHDLSIKDSRDSSMIEIETLEIDFNIPRLINKENNSIDKARIFGPNVHIAYLPEEENININLFIKKLREAFAPADSLPSSKKVPFTIQEVFLSRGTFHFNDARFDSIADGFDYYHFQLNDITTEIENLMVLADTFAIDVKSLTLYDQKTRLDVKQMQTQFLFSQEQMRFGSLLAEVGTSLLRDSIVFQYSGSEDLSSFIDSVRIEAHLENTHIHANELALFAPYLKRYRDSYEISGNFSGKVGRFRVKDIILSFGERSIVKGTVGFDGLPDFETTFIDANISTASISPADLHQYLVDTLITKTIDKFGTSRMNGRFIGFPNDFVTTAKFQTYLGRFSTDINLKLPTENEEMSYSGRLNLQQFDVGRLVNNPQLGLVTMNGQINGSGVSVQTANVYLKSNIESIDYLGYAYENITTDANLSREFFYGKMSIDDPFLSFTADGTIDLRKGINIIEIKGDLKEARLSQLNIAKDFDHIESQFNIKIKGLQLDSMVGKATLLNNVVKYKNRELSIDTMEFLSFKEKNERTLQFNSNSFELEAIGTYSYQNLYSDLVTLTKEYILAFENENDALKSYYSTKKKTHAERYKMDIHVLLKDFNPILQLALPQASVSANSQIQAEIVGGYTSIVAVNASIDTFSFKQNHFFNNIIDISTSKISDSTEVLAAGYLISKNQNFGGYAPSKEIIMEAIWDQSTIHFNGGIDQANQNNILRLSGELQFLKNKTVLKTNPSYLQIDTTKWELNSAGEITLADSSIYFNQISLTNQNQKVFVEGALSYRPEDTLLLRIENTYLESFNSIIARDLYGRVDGTIQVQDIYHRPLIQSNIGIDELTIDEFLMGDVKGRLQWLNDKKLLDVNANVTRLGKRIVQVRGSIAPQDSLNQLRLTGTFSEADLSLAEPFLGFLFSEMGGTVSGKIAINGRLDYPLLEGEGIIDQGKLKVNYLNTNYSVGGKIVFTENSIELDRVLLTDFNANTGILNGGIFHDGFTNFILNLKGETQSLMILNTTSKDNSLYYGTANATGEFEILGAVNNLYISAKAKSEKGTKIFIPVTESTVVAEKEEFITFIGADKKNTEKDVNLLKEKIDLTGIRMDLDLDITPDAYCEIIFDIKTGDIIRGRGNGKLKLEIDTKGDFFMFGNYEIVEGGYNFTLYNIINKEFLVKSGSTINWYGDPYNGIMDLHATYEQMASIAPLVDPQYAEVREIIRRYPATVDLFLKGPLLNPDISFNIGITGYPQTVNAVSESFSGTIDLGTIVNGFKNQIANDEQELNRQVFSLIILRRFSELESFAGSTSTLGNSVSEFLSNQLSYWVTQFDENLEIDIDLAGLDADAFNTFQLRLAYTFLDGRLRVSRDGGFTTAVENDQSAQVRGIVGEWTVEYLLTPDGKLRLKMYNKTNVNTLTSSLENTSSTTAGVSIIQVKSFDQISELWKRKREEKEEKEKGKPSSPPTPPQEGDALRPSEEESDTITSDS
ncbi:translocation/assembly module TamB domain-containing protein [Cytophagales bacterium LB-30]|uniref:Translocation/assembly module TamB domain-containing protein n=1 Tax=Shiella aurantiaca TaxID=3058365 RepID=A0ABT8F289_9BACT|nr:translocation/assembly module TamB domain-containing protein [Shiella aurantiaca]MDN4164366.1 translocation/assembly module TamB domain-containing protein [Shiella aurantiaca]